MRVLDLGGHDGYFGEWLASLDDVPVTRYDGLDLNPASVERANERLARVGVKGRFKVGAAEDAAKHFSHGTYDAVLCFEVIEHVEDVEALLRACDAMTRDGGQVYISTPTGVFGQGGNPLHLRAMQPSQLGDLLRRRGKLLDLEAGEDGTTSATYKPEARRGHVVIHTGSGWEKWAPADIHEKGLGGSETAAVRLALGLSDLDFTVTVYGNVKEGFTRDVIFRDERSFDPTEPCDLFIASRLPELADVEPNAKRMALWAHDTDFADRLTKQRADRFDYLLCLSRWHQRHLAKLYPFAASKLVRTRNGIHPPYYDGARPWEERDPLLLYTSSPDRGLDVMLDLWPDVLDRCRARDVDPTFAFCYAPVYDAVANVRPEVAKFRSEIEALISAREKVDALPPQPQPNLAQMLGCARVWAHPSWHSMGQQPFHETSCIGAMEAQASGCHVVASRWGALEETVQIGDLIGREGDTPGDEDFTEAFIDAIVSALCEDSGAQALAPGVVEDLSWATVAEQIADLAPSVLGTLKARAA